ncbi:MAG TPA: hypothetical protein PKV56_15580, partial [Burkholderiaceae bacterium]|nr:hypothetical protein [Burkholderiaceae bacterium]
MAPFDKREFQVDLLRHGALRIALLYALFGALWILGSDWLLHKLVSDPSWVVQIGAIKGWFFVGVTAWMLYLLIRRIPSGAHPSKRVSKAVPAQRAGWALLYVSIVALTLVALRFDYQHQHELERTTLHTLAELQARLVAHGYEDRAVQARFISSSPH